MRSWLKGLLFQNLSQGVNLIKKKVKDERERVM